MTKMHLNSVIFDLPRLSVGLHVLTCGTMFGVTLLRAVVCSGVYSTPSEFLGSRSRSVRHILYSMGCVFRRHALLS
jgi:hypothetical protein